MEKRLETIILIHELNFVNHKPFPQSKTKKSLFLWLKLLISSERALYGIGDPVSLNESLQEESDPSKGPALKSDRSKPQLFKGSQDL